MREGVLRWREAREGYFVRVGGKLQFSLGAFHANLAIGDLDFDSAWNGDWLFSNTRHGEPPQTAFEQARRCRTRKHRYR